MNKLLGFLELKEMRLPSIPWEVYKEGKELDDKYLWTIRSAVHRGDDMNLPRLVGEVSEKAKTFANGLLNQLGDNGMVIYYPYFIANKSGTFEVSSDKVIIEAVKADLWNLVTFSDREVTLIVANDGDREAIGKADFLCEEEVNELTKYVPEVRKVFRDDLLEGKSVLFEWSYALSCDKQKNPVGDEYLVFYEARTV